MRYLLGIAALLLTACGGGGRDNIPPADSINQAHELMAIDIVGTATDDIDGVAPINPAENSGQFVVIWAVSDPGSLYRVSLAVSSDEALSPDDVIFYARNCGGTSSECPESTETFTDCTFDNSNAIGCADDPASAADLSDFLDVIPKSAFILIQTCSIDGTDCTQSSHPVEFQ